MENNIKDFASELSNFLKTHHSENGIGGFTTGLFAKHLSIALQQEREKSERLRDVLKEVKADVKHLKTICKDSYTKMEILNDLDNSIKQALADFEGEKEGEWKN